MTTPWRHARGGIDRWLHRVGLRAASLLALPDFLGIGAQKAGTTWLYENLRAHPGLFLPETKELHYFDWAWDEPLASYARHFEPGRGRVTGEVTPGYSILPAARIRWIRRIMPDVRCLLLLRNPVDRAWSHAVKNLAEIPGRPVAAVPPDEWLDHFRRPGSVRRGDYPAILGRWHAVFPAEQIHVAFFDDIAARPRDLLGAVFAFLGVETPADWSGFPCERVVLPRYEADRVAGGYAADAGRVSTTAGIPEPARSFLRDYYRHDLEWLADRFGPPADAWRDGRPG
ncbi:MAG: sulfotransferase family protein [Planctomycetota bacterium]